MDKPLSGLTLYQAAAIMAFNKEEAVLQHARAEALQKELDEAYKQLDIADAIINGFINEDMNGVICSVPDPDPVLYPDAPRGLDAPISRNWCAKCQSRWKRAYAFVARQRTR